jgi:hypothetical protein
MQFDGFSTGTLPFDVTKKNYPEGLFEITSGATVNGGTLVIREASAFAGAAMVDKGLIAINGEIQKDNNRLNFAWYLTVKQKS